MSCLKKIRISLRNQLSVECCVLDIASFVVLKLNNTLCSEHRHKIWVQCRFIIHPNPSPMIRISLWKVEYLYIWVLAWIWIFMEVFGMQLFLFHCDPLSFPGHISPKIRAAVLWEPWIVIPVSAKPCPELQQLGNASLKASAAQGCWAAAGWCHWNAQLGEARRGFCCSSAGLGSVWWGQRLQQPLNVQNLLFLGINNPESIPCADGWDTTCWEGNLALQWPWFSPHCSENVPLNQK